jgi:Glycosyl hydrolase family 76
VRRRSTSPTTESPATRRALVVASEWRYLRGMAPTRAKAAFLAALTAAALVLAALAAVPAGAAGRAHYAKVASKGIADARKRWWNSSHHWYDDRLNDTDRYPLATIWSIVPLWEAIDGRAIGNPSSKNRAAVESFANFAEKYWNPAVNGYGPYPGNRTASETWFDDNGWWGMAFVDAYRATHKKRYLDDAKRASNFIDARGWDGSRGMWWTTYHNEHSLEAMSSATALAAELYEQTGNSAYRKRARKYISWANKHATENDRGLYSTKRQPVLSYVEGAMIGAHLALCRKGDKGACKKARKLAQACFDKWQGKSPNHAPQFDTILLRYVIQLGEQDRDPTWYDWARRVADQAEKKAKTDGLFLRFWDGSKATAHGDGAGRFKAGMIQTHAATVSLFAWLGAYDRPPGKARKPDPGGAERPKWQTYVTVEPKRESGETVCVIQGHIRGYSSKSVSYDLDMAVTKDRSTETKHADGTAKGGEKTTDVVTYIARHGGSPNAPPLEVTVTGKVAGKKYVTHKQLAPPWC